MLNFDNLPIIQPDVDNVPRLGDQIVMIDRSGRKWFCWSIIVSEDGAFTKTAYSEKATDESQAHRNAIKLLGEYLSRRAED